MVTVAVVGVETYMSFCCWSAYEVGFFWSYIFELHCLLQVGKDHSISPRRQMNGFDKESLLASL